MKSCSFCRRDAVLAAVILFTALGLFLAGLIRVSAMPAAEEITVGVYVDGGCRESCSLQDEKSFSISSEGGFNEVVVSGGTVHVESADCPGQDCVKAGSISKPGQEIICLPHKLVVRIEGASDTDAVAR